MDESREYLSRGLQKILFWIHITAAGTLLGNMFGILLLVLSKGHFKSPEQLYPVDFMIYQILNILVTYAFIVIILSAFIYGIFTRWGFFRHYWIMTKWLLALVVFALVWFLWGPAIDGMVSLSDGRFVLDGARHEYLNKSHIAFISTIIGILITLLIFLVSVFKPWGVRATKALLKEKSLRIVATIILLIGLFFTIFSSITLNHYRTIPIADSDLNKIPDGLYTGQTDIGGFVYGVKVKVYNHKIDSIAVLHNRTSSYARYAEGVIPRIISRQNANVQGITGATTTSKALMKAVENALKAENK
jgi:uncharacterized protein with FMN-binding domain